MRLLILQPLLSIRHSGALILLVFCAAQSRGQTLGDALNAPDLVWTTGGNGPWLVETNITHDGQAALSTGSLGIGQTNWIETTVVGPTAISFREKVSTCGFSAGSLSFSIGGATQNTFSGELDWQQHNFYVPPGTNTLQWAFDLSCTSIVDQNMAWLDEVALLPPAAPTIVTQPTNQTVLAGDALSIVVGVAGTEPFFFQWQREGIDLAGSTNHALSIGDAQATNSGNYSVIISSQYGAVTSQVANVSVAASSPAFTQQPTSQSCTLGATFTFSATAKGSEPLSGVWYSNGVAIAGSTSAPLTISNVQASSFCDYWIVMTNASGSTTSMVATLTRTPLLVWGAQTFIPPGVTNVMGLAGGDSHYLALRGDGTVLAWGTDFGGQTLVPADATNIVSIGAGSIHSLAARADGSVLLWGRILGSFTTNVPAGLTNAAMVAPGPGAQHALALRTDGTLIDWGASANVASSLTNIPSAATNIISIAAGAFHSLALRADGTVVAWGGNSYGEGTVPPSASNVVAVSAGWYQNLALRADGTLVQWGYQMGSIPQGATNIVAIACGGNHNLALRADGKLFAWGENYSGQITIPAWATNVVGIAGTSSASLALQGDGQPLVSTALINRSVLVGGKVYFRVTAVGAWPLNYQWRFNGTDLVDATNQLLTILNAQPQQAGAYSVVVSNASGTASSPAVFLTVLPNESIILSQSFSVKSGQTHFFATGTAGFKWSVQASSNLVDWLDLRTLTNTTGMMLFNESGISAVERFYRLRLVP